MTVNGLPSRKKPSLHKNLTVEPTVLLPTAMAFLGVSGAGHVLSVQKTVNIDNFKTVIVLLLNINVTKTSTKKA